MDGMDVTDAMDGMYNLDGEGENDRDGIHRLRRFFSETENGESKLRETRKD